MFDNDEFTCEIDTLGYKQQADAIRDLIIECKTPYAIGISGRWGSGKTSLMKYIMASLNGKPLSHRLKFHDKTINDEEESRKFKSVIDLYPDKGQIKHIVPIWFNPWEYENHDEPFVELLKEIHHFFNTTILLNSTKKIAHTSIRAGLDILANFFNLGDNPASHIQSLGEKYEQDHFAYTHRSQQFKLLFQTAVEKLLTGAIGGKLDKNARLVIFIDDLDRCEENVIGRLLKEIKQHLSTQYCVFVFGYDRHHIEKALSQNNNRSLKESRAYLEKLFQSTIYIKQPDKTKLTTYINEQLNPETGLYTFVNNRSNQTALTTFLLDILDPNPRRMKYFFTAFHLHVKANIRFQNKSAIKLDDLQRLALMVYLKLFYEAIYSALENDPTVLSAILAIFRTHKEAGINDFRECFVYLETKGHLSTKDIVLEDAQKTSILQNGDSEKKFLTEVNEMQGKHKSFANFMQKFERWFSG